MKIRVLPLLIFLFTGYACSEVKHDSITFAWLTDIHVQPGQESSRQLREIIGEINTMEFDFVIVTGDLANQGSDWELLNVKEILDGLKIPYYIIPGNHETNWSESAGQTFVSLWGDDKFAFVKGNTLFVGINTGPFMRMGDGHIKQEDVRWLRDLLRKEMNNNRELLFFSHYPLAEGLDQWYVISEILRQHNTLATFCGHGHNLQIFNAGNIPGIMGRSMVLRGENIPGYNIVSLSNDSILVFEKLTGQPIEKVRYKFAKNDSKLLGNLEPSPLPDYSVNHEYSHIKAIWQHRDSSSVFTGPLIIGDSLIVYGNSTGQLKAIQYPSGNVKWEVEAEGAFYSTPALTSMQTIIAADVTGNIFSVGLETGNIKWHREKNGPVLSAPLMDGDVFYLPIGTEGVFKMDALTGETLWCYSEVAGLMQARPVKYRKNLIFTAWDTHLYCLDSSTGELIWKWNNGRPIPLFSPGNVVPVISNGKVFIVAPDRFMTALDLATGNEIWRTNRHQVRESMGVSSDGESVFAKLMNDTIIAVNTTLKRFSTRWVEYAGFGYDHNPCPMVTRNHILFAGTRNGFVVAVNKKNGELLWKHKTGNSAINFFNDDTQSRYIWLTTTDGKIIALPKL